MTSYILCEYLKQSSYLFVHEFKKSENQPVCNKYYFVHANLENIIHRHEIEFVTMAMETKQPEYDHMTWFLKEH